MVAGMVMPLADLRAIYELLFRDGVMVAKKDRRPQCMHPEIQGVANVKVMRAMGSLKSKGFVRETFAWKHSYWYLTNEGIVYLRDYLRLPPEIMPSSLQRVRRPTSTLDVMRRARRGVVQTVEGPTSYAPKPRVGQESQEGMIDRQGYRHKRGPPGEEEALGEKPAMRFRGSYQGRGRGAVGEPGAETQAFFRRGQGFRREEQRVPEEGQRRGFAPRGPAHPPPLEARPVRSPSPAPAKEVKPFVTEVPAPAPIKPEKPQEVAVLVPVAQIIEPAFIPAVEPEAQAPALELEEVVEEVTVEEVAVEAPMPVEEAEPEEEEVSAVEAAEVLSDVWEQEEPKPVVEEIEEAAEEAPEPVVVEVVEAIKEEVLEATAPVETLEEEPKQSAEVSAEESVEESTEDVAEEVEDVVEKVTATEVVVVEEATAIQVVVVEDAPEVPAEDLPHDTDIEILEEPEEVGEEPSTHEEPEASSSEASSDSEASEPEPITAAVAIEAESEPATTTEGAVEVESEPVTITEAIQEVKASVPLTKDDSTEPDSDTDLSNPPPPVTEDFTDLTEYHEQTVVGHITQEIPTMVTFRSEMPLEVTSQVVTSTVYSTVVEKVFETQISQSEAFMEPPSIGIAGIVSQLGLEQETSALFGAECTAPVIPSECPIAALKSSLPQGDLAFLTEEPEEEEEEEEEVKKIWPDTLEG